MQFNPKTRISYSLIGGLLGFTIVLIGMTVEDFHHDIPFSHAISEFHHYLSPIILGILGAIVGYSYWNYKYKNHHEINKYTNNLKALLEINMSFTSTLDLDEVLQIIVNKSTEFLNLNSGAIYLHYDETLFLGATTPPLPASFPDSVRYDKLANHPHIQKALSLGQSILLSDTSSEPLSDAERAIVEQRNLKSILYLPLIIEHRPVGTLILGTTKYKKEFSNHEIGMCSTFSSGAALAIENARLFRETSEAAELLKMHNEKIHSANKKLEEQNIDIQEINQKLERAKEKAENSDRLKSAFLNNLSHEIRTPMNAIIGFSRFLENSDISAEKRSSYVNYITNGCNQLLKIVENVLEMSPLETKQVTPKFEKFCLNEVLRNLAIFFRPAIKEKGLKFNLNENLKDNESYIINDEVILTKIIGNLIENAIKFTEKGFIEIGSAIKNSQIEITIKDSGIGINEEYQEKIFERFSQEDKETSIKAGGGLGVGLSIAKENADLINGEIKMKSAKGKGSTFYLSLPYRSSTQENTLQNANKTKNFFNILIAEDEDANYLYLETLLTTEYQFKSKITHAKTGQEAIDFFKKENNFDLVLMDLKMPVMNGYEATKKIKEIKANIPVIALTAYSTDEDKNKALLAGCDEFITKPVDIEIFEKVLEKYLILQND